MKIIRKMPDMAELRSQLALTPEQQLRRQERIKEIEAVITGQDKRLLLLIGPCSADRRCSIGLYGEAGKITRKSSTTNFDCTAGLYE